MKNAIHNETTVISSSFSDKKSVDTSVRQLSIAENADSNKAVMIISWLEFDYISFCDFLKFLDFSWKFVWRRFGRTFGSRQFCTLLRILQDEVQPQAIKWPLRPRWNPRFQRSIADTQRCVARRNPSWVRLFNGHILNRVFQQCSRILVKIRQNIRPKVLLFSNQYRISVFACWYR